MSETKYRRSRTRIILHILTEASDGTTKTRLIYRCNINSIRLDRYLRELSNADLVDPVDQNNTSMILYKTTDKGHEFRKVLLEASEFLSI